MIKEDIKLLCETDPQLQWWAMVLYAELCSYYEEVVYQAGNKLTQSDYDLLINQLRYKVEEFPKIVIHHQIQKAKKEAEKCQQTTPRSEETTTESSPPEGKPTGT